ncbi:ATP-binding cassette domain-containing protein [Actinobacteria bacterium YIM 96077]|uniref:ATP-binding cassette domain-containing protein n=1 Tax=Phytoactinopolyspora halophila TaxID=1981511 RepID=UPI000F4D6788|nr:ATP-binding cassette domain-containing protein [Phytoactinopolyspora halophila]AYY13347.1 ATP-binding cassette domain-containing protein [Actinobacteria bacterium YIM 96077]
MRAEADWLIEDLGVRTTAETAYVSGGEAQRLALARALITQPSLLLADEPTGALDRATRDEVLEVMFTKIRSAEMAAVIVTHDEEVAFSADRIIELSAARPVEAT